MIREIKEIHPEYLAIVKIGTFFCAYGKDAGILSDLFGYQFKDVEDTITCGFPVASLKKVQAKLA